MYYAKIENNQIVKTHINLSDEVPAGAYDNPTEADLLNHGVVIVHAPETLPEHDETTHGLVDSTPILGADGKWYATYEVIEKIILPNPDSERQ